MQIPWRTSLLAPLLFLSACPSIPRIDDLRVAESGCPAKIVTLVAKDANKNGMNPGGTTHLSIKPDTVEVDAGCFIIINNPGKHDFTTAPIDAAGAWLNGSTSEAPLVLGPATCKTDPCTDDDIYKYTITVDGVGVLDPRAWVR